MTVKSDWFLHLTLQLGMSSLPESVFAAPLDMEHTIYSEKKITVNMERASINGTAFSGKGYIRAKNDIRYDAVKNEDSAEL